MGDPVALVGNPAAHYVEEGVGEVATRAELVLGDLKAVGAGHDPNETPGAALYILVNLGAHVALRSEEAEHCHHISRFLTDLGHDVPFSSAFGGKRQPGTKEVGPASPTGLRLLLHGMPLAKTVEL